MTVFALDAQAGDIATLLVAGAAVGVSLLLVFRGSWWSVAIPGVICALGFVAFLGSEPPPESGGDTDPQRLVAGVFLTVGVAWLGLAVVATGIVRWMRYGR